MSAHITSGRQRRGKTIRWQVRALDRLASATITIGGIGTIVSVSLVLVLLLWVVWPLLMPGQLGTGTTYPTSIGALSPGDSPPLAIVPDEYRLLAWVLKRDGHLQVIRLDSGQVLSDQVLVSGGDILAAEVLEPEGEVAVAQGDGALRLGRISFATRFLDDASLPAAVAALPRGGVAPFEDGLAQRTHEGQLRHHRVVADLRPPVALKGNRPRLLAQTPRARGPLLAMLDEDGQLQFGSLKIPQTMTRKTVLRPSLKPVPLPRQSEKPWRLLMPQRGDSLYVVWRNGRLARFDTREPGNVKLAETIDLVEGGGKEVTAIGFAPGRETLLVGDNQGRLRAWFRVRNAAALTPDGAWLLPIRELPPRHAAVTSVGVSPRLRMVAVGYSDGQIQVSDITTGKSLTETTALAGQRISWTALTPKSPPKINDGESTTNSKDVVGGVLALSDKAMWQAPLDPGHPEATFGTLFRPVWYESYERPDHVWHTSSADVTAEPKFGLWPLVFGTIKATVYAMLFGAPLALLAALFTSEFLPRPLRLRIKSLVEMMASLPSVVLGFVAAIVIAPVAEKFVPAILASLATIPLPSCWEPACGSSCRGVLLCAMCGCDSRWWRSCCCWARWERGSSDRWRSGGCSPAT